MTELENKYIDNTLSPAELKELRKKVNSSTDDELAEEMKSRWDTAMDEDDADEETLSRMRDEIHRRTRNNPFMTARLQRFLLAAAAVIIPLLIFSFYKLYTENIRISSEQIAISTLSGERTTVTLPDGTKVSLNENSRLLYAPKSFNKDERCIHFSGEAYFNVTKNKECPFIVDAHEVKVKVLGTKFNFRERKKEGMAELTLQEGCVNLSTIFSKETVVMQRGQRAVVDYATGKITLTDKADINNISSWRTGQLNFDDTPLLSVITTIENAYRVKIMIEDKNLSKDNFTGTIPTNNLNVALRILSEAYDMNYKVSKHIVSLTGK